MNGCGRQRIGYGVNRRRIRSLRRRSCVGINEGSVFEHRTYGRFIIGIGQGGSGKRVGHRKVVNKRYIVLADGVVDLRMKAEVVR